MSDCLFCAFVAGSATPDVVRRDDGALAFRDIDPQAPTHVLVVPTVHLRDAAELAEHPESLTAVLQTAAAVARDEGLDEGWRLVLNTGPAAGQTVFHVHAHVLGGRSLTWPPG
jgi:histidine triad (HIT) family protein